MPDNYLAVESKCKMVLILTLLPFQVANYNTSSEEKNAWLKRYHSFDNFSWFPSETDYWAKRNSGHLFIPIFLRN